MDDKISSILDKYNFDDDWKKEFLDIASSVCLHPEFQKRCGQEFFHHGSVSVGEHIIEDAVKTYLLSKKYTSFLDR